MLVFLCLLGGNLNVHAKPEKLIVGFQICLLKIKTFTSSKLALASILNMAKVQINIARDKTITELARQGNTTLPEYSMN